MSQLADIRPYLDVVAMLIADVNSVPQHTIVDELARDNYLSALLDVKIKLLDMVDDAVS